MQASIIKIEKKKVNTILLFKYTVKDKINLYYIFYTDLDLYNLLVSVFFD